MSTYNEQERQIFELGRTVRAGLTQPLGSMRPGSVGRILAVSSGMDGHDIERGLLEMGFVEGARVEVLHHGFLGQDPLAVRINQTMTVALRRCEANAVLVGPLHDPAVDVKPVMTLEYASS
ncbi:MAG: ferrous iron transport protein A [Gammaproteobacteria bacterium]|nr:ferrous iron transport protein A [Gammaproteobacteria bacterium]